MRMGAPAVEWSALVRETSNLDRPSGPGKAATHSSAVRLRGHGGVGKLKSVKIGYATTAGPGWPIALLKG